MAIQTWLSTSLQRPFPLGRAVRRRTLAMPAARGERGPIDSIRWEVFAESLQDYALLQTLGVERDGALLAPLKDFDDFPKDERWIRAARRRLLCSQP